MNLKKVTDIIKFKKISQNFILYVTFFSHVTLFSIPKNLLHIVRNKIKKELWQMVEKQKCYSNSKNVQKTQNF